MNDNNVVAASLSYRTARSVPWHRNISAVVQELHGELRYVSSPQAAGAKRQQAFSPSRLAAILVVVVALPAFRLAVAEGIDPYLAREGKTPIIIEESTSRYERKLFLTPDEVARYVFLTNRYDDGDRSAAVYRARRKKGSLPGEYWLTATVAADSVRDDHRNVRVRRFDAPLPTSTADAVHDLWLTVLEQSRTDEEAIPVAPTGVLYVTNGGA